MKVLSKNKIKVLKEILIIIPARQGSQGIKNKNIRNIHGFPLLAYSIEAAKKFIEKKKEIYLSTDSKKILYIGRKFFPFSNDIKTRPKKISQNFSRDIEFINHALAHYSKKNFFFKNCLILRPTNPIRRLSTLNSAYKVFKKNLSCSSLKSIAISEKSLFKMWIRNKKNIITNLAVKSKKIEIFNEPRQLLPRSYIQTGTIEFLRLNYKNKIFNFSGKKIYGFLVDSYEALDIDRLHDLRSVKISKNFIFPVKCKKKKY